MKQNKKPFFNKKQILVALLEFILFVSVAIFCGFAIKMGADKYELIYIKQQASIGRPMETVELTPKEKLKEKTDSVLIMYAQSIVDDYYDDKHHIITKITKKRWKKGYIEVNVRKDYDVPILTDERLDIPIESLINLMEYYES